MRESRTVLLLLLTLFALSTTVRGYCFYQLGNAYTNQVYTYNMSYSHAAFGNSNDYYSKAYDVDVCKPVTCGSSSYCSACQTQYYSTSICTGYYSSSPKIISLDVTQYAGTKGVWLQYTGATSYSCPQNNRITNVYVLCGQPENAITSVTESPTCTYNIEFHLQDCSLKPQVPSLQFDVIGERAVQMSIGVFDTSLIQYYTVYRHLGPDATSPFRPVYKGKSPVFVEEELISETTYYFSASVTILGTENPKSAISAVTTYGFAPTKAPMAPTSGGEAGIIVLNVITVILLAIIVLMGVWYYFKHIHSGPRGIGINHPSSSKTQPLADSTEDVPESMQGGGAMLT